MPPNLLKPALARGEMQCIGATYPGMSIRKYIERDAALERRFPAGNHPSPLSPRNH